MGGKTKRLQGECDDELLEQRAAEEGLTVEEYKEKN